HGAHLSIRPAGYRVPLGGNRRVGRGEQGHRGLALAGGRDRSTDVRAGPGYRWECRLLADAAEGIETGDLQGGRLPGRRLGGRQGVRGQEISVRGRPDRCTFGWRPRAQGCTTWPLPVLARSAPFLGPE